MACGGESPIILFCIYIGKSAYSSFGNNPPLVCSWCNISTPTEEPLVFITNCFQFLWYRVPSGLSKAARWWGECGGGAALGGRGARGAEVAMEGRGVQVADGHRPLFY